MESIQTGFNKRRAALEKINPRGHFHQQPNIITKDPNVTNAEHRVYSILLMMSRRNGFCWPSQQKIAEYMGRSSKNKRLGIGNILKSLAKKGYIKITRNYRTSNKYEVLIFVKDSTIIDNRVNKNLHPP